MQNIFMFFFIILERFQKLNIFEDSQNSSIFIMRVLRTYPTASYVIRILLLTSHVLWEEKELYSEPGSE